MTQFAHTGEPGTCLYCGKRIPPVGTNHGDRACKVDGVPVFHSDGCAIRFALLAVEKGVRYVVKPTTPPALPPETPEERARNAMQAELLKRARTLVPQLRASRRCADCGKSNELTGHQDCAYPGRHAGSS